MSIPLRIFSPDDDPTTAQTPRRRRRLPDFLRADELAALFEAAYTLWQQTTTQPKWRLSRQRDWLMIQLAYYCGLRVAELCNLEVVDIDLAGGLLIVRHGKGDADGTVPISSKLLPELAEWVGDRKAGVLFPDPRGRHVHTRHFRSRLKLLAKRAGIARRCSPHTLRHSFATHLLRKGATIYEVQLAMRHASIATTQIYLHLVPGRLSEIVELL